MDEIAHHFLALLVPAGALTARASQAWSVTTFLAVRYMDIIRATAGVACTFLFHVARARTSTADSVGRCELTVDAASFVGVIAYCPVLEFTGFGVTAVVVSARFFASAVAVFP